MHEDNHFAINNLQYVEEYLSSIEQKIGHLKVKNYITILVIPLFSILISVFGIVYKFDEVARYTVLFHFVWYLIISMIIIGILYGLISHAIAIVFQKM